LMITNVRSEILRRVCTEGFICNGGKFEMLTGADESMSNKRCSVIVETVSDVSECFQVIVARLGDLVGMFIESETLV